ncbi:hypothetical protein AAFF_G00412600 [Aldrovandia affinis]|uniref:Uncharacterized protein n=1 Tax=Aldrovandia affinis TaxID=143900 RepID=A0AAD7WJH5_9TELE|nr:hypothetical protein AAFF_G00412600 [Aldrovandia affinis]
MGKMLLQLALRVPSHLAAECLPETSLAALHRHFPVFNCGSTVMPHLPPNTPQGSSAVCLNVEETGPGQAQLPVPVRRRHGNSSTPPMGTPTSHQCSMTHNPQGCRARCRRSAVVVDPEPSTRRGDRCRLKARRLASPLTRASEISAD